MYTRLAVVFMLVSSAAIAYAQDIALNGDGQTISWTSPLAIDQPVTIAVSSDEPLDTFELRYRPVSTLANPVRLTKGDEAAPRQITSRALFTVPAPSTGFTIYNLWRKTESGPSAEDRATAQQRRDAIDARITTLEQQLRDHPSAARIAKLEKELKELNAAAGEATENQKEIERLKRQIGELEKERDVYVKIPVSRSVAAIEEIQRQIRPLHERLGKLESVESEPNPRIAEVTKLLASTREDTGFGQLETDLNAQRSARSRETDILDRTDHFEVLKIGILVAGRNRKALYYNLSGTSTNKTLQLRPVGDVPLLVDRDLIYLVISRPASAAIGALSLSVGVTEGDVIDSNPVRPTTELSPESGNREFGTTNVFEDVVLPFVRPARGNDILKMTVKTYAEVTTVDKVEVEGKTTTETKTTEKADVELLKDAELPQVHPLYRFNVTTGLAYSGIREPEFQKVQTALDDTSTTDVNEARYRIDTDEGSRKVRPILALTIYWKPNDPLQRLTTRERLTPNPTIALGFTDPAENVFVGFSNELWRGVQVLWGIHRGRVDVLTHRSDVDEDQKIALPPLRKETREKFFVGVTLNLDFLTRLIKLPS